MEMRTSGMSYSEICRRARISKSTLTAWFNQDETLAEIKSMLLSKNAEISTKRLQSLNKTRGSILSAYYLQAEHEAMMEIKNKSTDPLFILGLGLYLGEGDKVSKNSFRISNSDPNLIRLFIKFLLQSCSVPIEKIRLYLMIYEDTDPIEAIQYWKNHLGVSESNFGKPYFLQGRHKTKRLPYGTCIASVANSYLKRKMLIWLKELPKML